ncbi:hypothetical protein AB205_0162710, partial [Aquarana catesbeiana]
MDFHSPVLQVFAEFLLSPSHSICSSVKFHLSAKEDMGCSQ